MLDAFKTRQARFLKSASGALRCHAVLRLAHAYEVISQSRISWPPSILRRASRLTCPELQQIGCLSMEAKGANATSGKISKWARPSSMQARGLPYRRARPRLSRTNAIGMYRPRAEPKIRFDCVFPPRQLIKVKRPLQSFNASTSLFPYRIRRSAGDAGRRTGELATDDRNCAAGPLSYRAGNGPFDLPIRADDEPGRDGFWQGAGANSSHGNRQRSAFGGCEDPLSCHRVYAVTRDDGHNPVRRLPGSVAAEHMPPALMRRRRRSRMACFDREPV